MNAQESLSTEGLLPASPTTWTHGDPLPHGNPYPYGNLPTTWVPHTTRTCSNMFTWEPPPTTRTYSSLFTSEPLTGEQTNKQTDMTEIPSSKLRMQAVNMIPFGGRFHKLFGEI